MSDFLNIQQVIADIVKIENTDYGISGDSELYRRYWYVEFVKNYSEFYPTPAQTENELVLRIETFLKKRQNILFLSRDRDYDKTKTYTIWKYLNQDEGVPIHMEYVDATDDVEFVTRDAMQDILDEGFILCIYDNEARTVRHYDRIR